MGEKITIAGKDGFRFGAYLAEPEGKPKGGVLICQEIFGVNPKRPIASCRKFMILKLIPGS